MPIILIVDDDKNFLLSLVEGLKTLDKEFQIMTAANGKLATQILEEEEIDLVITDLKMPVMDGFELLAHMSSRYPRIPVIVMTAYGTPIIEDSVSDLGAIRYLEKPLEFDLLVENIHKSVQPREDHYLDRVPLVSFLKLVQMEKKTCVLTIRTEEREGKLFFKKGALLDAETESGRGEAAVMEILEWEQAEIQISSKFFVRGKYIHNDLDFLIMVFESRRPVRNGSGNGHPASADYHDSALDDIFNLGGGSETEEPEQDQPDIEPDAVVAEPNHTKDGQDPSLYEEDNEENRERASPYIPEVEKAPEPPNVEQEATGREQILPGENQEEASVLSDSGEDEQKYFEERKENTVNVKKMHEALDTLKDSAGPGLLACDIFSGRDGQSIVGYNSNPAYCAMSNQVTHFIRDTLKESGFPHLGSLYMVDLTDNKMVVVMIVDEYQWGILVDSTKCSMGILLNVALPRAKKVFQDALAN